MKFKVVFIPLVTTALLFSSCALNGEASSSKRKGRSGQPPLINTSSSKKTSDTSWTTFGSSSDISNAGGSTGGSTKTSSGNSTSTSKTSTGTTPYIPSTSSSTSSTSSGGTIDPNFTIKNESNEASGFTVSGSTYTINTAGTYTLEGALNGEIRVEVGESDTVELDLKGVEITSSSNSPIFGVSAKKLKIKAIKDTSNRIIDSRSKKTSEIDSQGEGAIAAKCDLNFIGSGSLYVEGNYNNGVHTSKDLKIKNLKLRSYGYQHAIRGGNSITIVNNSTEVYAIGTTGDGLKTNDAGVSSNGNQKGSIEISGGLTTIHCLNDGIDAAYDVNIQKGQDEDSLEESIPTINIYTDRYASLTKTVARPGPGGGGPGGSEGNTNKSSTTAKGIKAANTLNVSDGQIYVKAYDDGLHATAENLTDSDGISTGVKGLGNVNISGGNITLDVSDDGIHADNILNVSDGVISVTNSYEGLEANKIDISGGHVYVYASDDGINAAGNGTPAITISGGYVEIEVSLNGDTDGVDSNGTYTQTGGILIAKGPASGGASALDTDGKVTLNGGTTIVLGSIEQQGGGGWGGGGSSGNFSVGSNMQSYSLSLHKSGSHTINIGGVSYTFTNKTTFGKTICYSDVAVSGS